MSVFFIIIISIIGEKVFLLDISIIHFLLVHVCFVLWSVHSSHSRGLVSPLTRSDFVVHYDDLFEAAPALQHFELIILTADGK